jgi:hypothetical protein
MELKLLPNQSLDQKHPSKSLESAATFSSVPVTVPQGPCRRVTHSVNLLTILFSVIYLQAATRSAIRPVYYGIEKESALRSLTIE